MKTCIHLFFYVFLFTQLAIAQKATLSGTVIDAAAQPLVGVNIGLKGTVRGAQTNIKGEYLIEAIPTGNYELVITYLGHHTLTKNITIGAAETIQTDFTLTESNVALADVHIVTNRGVRGNEHLAEVEGYAIHVGKKNELVKLSNIDANLAMNNSRQIFGRVPGISVWESDGSGIQTSIASRGLSPNRSWEFNTRVNGYDITPDPMGYPEAYYTPPMEVVERIEIVRGASSLQYGSQFGGLLNFVLRKPDISTRFTAESQNTVGSNGLLSTFNYVGGTAGRLSYTAYYQKRKGNGWRDNSYFNTDHAHVALSYAVSNHFKIGAEATYMDYISQQSGGLTDAQFTQNPQQSNRSRNWFAAPWFVPALTADYIFSEKTKLNFKAFGTYGERNSIGFTKAINLPDDKSNRQIDRDFYKNIGTELRLVTDYTLFKQNHTLATGIRYFSGNTTRWQQGTGDNGTAFSTQLLPNTMYNRDLKYHNQNAAAFAENIFRINKRLLFTAGLRYEYIQSAATGRLSVTNGKENLLAAIARTRNFVIAGIGAEYHPTAQTAFYSNISQAYRPVLFGDLTPPATTDVIDQNLKDAKGYNFDIGYRGRFGKFLNFDVDYFYLNYDNRIGTITQENDNKVRYQFRTNVGNSLSKGIETYIEFDPLAAFANNPALGNLSLFASIAHIDAQYKDFKTTTIVDGKIIAGTLSGKKIENAPQKINRYGITYSKKGGSITWQMSDIGAAFSDASNTTTANAAATTGLIPAYQVQDLSASLKFLKHYHLKLGINNLSNTHYFTRRAGGYPGPGILPADGRTWYVSGGVKF
jgi:Fe(3+) dicitrate transport protein